MDGVCPVAPNRAVQSGSKDPLDGIVGNALSVINPLKSLNVPNANLKGAMLPSYLRQISFGASRSPSSKDSIKRPVRAAGMSRNM